jgi:hypothetical protein
VEVHEDITGGLRLQCSIGGLLGVALAAAAPDDNRQQRKDRDGRAVSKVHEPQS